MNEWTWVAAAYALTWVGLGGYALRLERGRRRARRALLDAREVRP